MADKTEFAVLTDHDGLSRSASNDLPPRPTKLPSRAAASQEARTPKLGEVTPLRETQILADAKRSKELRVIVIIMGLISAVVTIGLVIQMIVGQPEIAPHGGVVSNSGHCSNLAMNTLRTGGSAVDAAIVAMLCVGVVNPQSGGIGGGGFMIVHDHKKHESVVFDFRETAPMSSASEKFDPNEPKSTQKYVGVPGELKGMYEAHKQFGKKQWRDLFDPIIKLCRSGFHVTEAFMNATVHRQRIDDATGVAHSSHLNEYLAAYKSENTETTAILHAGLPVKRRDLANIFEILAKNGPDAFYLGQYAKEVVEATGGKISLEDLKNYTVKIEKPLIGQFKDYEVETIPSPGSGAILLLMLNLLELSLEPEMFDSPKGMADFYLQLAEAISIGSKEQERLGDESVVSEIEAEMIKKEYAASIYNRTTPFDKRGGDSSRAKRVLSEDGRWQDFGTSHISVIDNNDLMVSVTHSLNFWFGSLIQTKSGILLNNQLADFDFSDKLKNNQIAVGKRPLSSMVPTIVYHKTRPCYDHLAIGGTNASHIPSSVAAVIAEVLAYNLRIDHAIDLPRLYCHHSSNDCEIEDLSPELENALRSTSVSGWTHADPLGTVEAVLRHNDSVLAYGDQRTDAVGVSY